MRRNEKKNNKIIKLIIISIILSIIYELILKFLVKNNDVIHIYNIIIDISVICFILLHFSIGFRKLYDYIIENRFKLSVIMVIFLSILGIMEHVSDIKSWIFTINEPLCIFWNISFFVLILVNFELFLIITDNRYMSVVGTILVAFSGCVQWDFNIISLPIIFGESFVLLINKYLNKKGKKNIIVYAVLFSLIISFYIFIDKSISVSFGYVFFALSIWIIIKNKENINIKSLVKLLIMVTLIILALYFIKSRNYIYTANIVNENEYGSKYAFSYIYNILLPFKNTISKEVYGSFFSLFPVPMLMALYYIFNHDQHIEFLLPLTIVSVIETIFCISGFPEIVRNILLFENVNVIYTAMSLNFINLLIAFYFLANIDEKIFSVKVAMRVTIVFCVMMLLVKFPNEYVNRLYLTIYIGELASTIFLFLNFEDKKYKKTLLALLLIFTLIGGIPVNKLTVRNSNNISISELEN